MGAGGLFWKLRSGQFDPAAFQRALGKLTAISIPERAFLPRRVVSLLWFIPSFMQWQIHRVGEMGGDVAAYGKAITLMTNQVERLLGVP